MEIVSAGIRGPLVSDERGESARRIRLVRCLDRFEPGRAVSLSAGHGKNGLGDGSFSEVDNDFKRRVASFSRMNHLVPSATLRVSHDLRIAGQDHREKPEAVRVIGHDEEVKWARELRALAAGGHDLLALAETIRVLRSEPAAERARVHRE